MVSLYRYPHRWSCRMSWTLWFRISEKPCTGLMRFSFATVGAVAFLCSVGVNLHLFSLYPSLLFYLLASSSILHLVLLPRDLLGPLILHRLSLWIDKVWDGPSWSPIVWRKLPWRRTPGFGPPPTYGVPFICFSNSWNRSSESRPKKLRGMLEVFLSYFGIYVSVADSTC